MKLTYRKDIDGIRAIAVLSVLFFHAFPNFLKGGFVGVDIFFVISGFLISNIILSQNKTQSFSWINFYIKRIKRIFPSLIVLLIFLITIGYFFLFSEEYKLLGKHILMSSIFSNNFLLLKETGYFDISSHFKPLLHLWSLGIEEQFYIIWPIIIFIGYQYRQSIFVWMILITTASFLINLILVKHASNSAFYLPFSRIWELSIGGITAYLYQNHSSLTIRLYKRNIISLISFSLIIFCILYFNQSILYPSWYALLPTIATALLIFFQQTFMHQYVLENQLLRLIGLISYPLYLWHWGFLSLAHIFYEGDIPQNVIYFIIFFSFIVSYLCYAWIETPIRRNHNKKFETNIAMFLLTCMVCLGFMGNFIYSQNGFNQRTLNLAQAIELKDMNDFSSYQKKMINCNIAKKIHFPEVCLQNKKGQPQYLVWGDSHAEHLFPGLVKKDHLKNTWRLEKTSNCPPLKDVRAHWKGEEDICYQTNLNVLETIKKEKNIHTVILSSIALFYMNEIGIAFEHQGKNSPINFKLEIVTPSEKTLSNKDIFKIGYENTIEALHQMGKNIIIIHDVPELPFMPSQCIGRPFFQKNQFCQLNHAQILKQQYEYHLLLRQLKEKYPYIKIYNTINDLCQNNSCKLKKNGHLIYRDSSHLSLYGSALVSKNFYPWIMNTMKT